MIEIEIKLPLKGSPAEALNRVRSQLKFMGFRVPASREGTHLRETDIYMDNAEGYIRHSHQALRVRLEEDLNTGTTKALVTFKGQKLDSITATRKEIETEASDGQAMLAVFDALGYQAVEPKVIKERSILTKEDITACLDWVEGLGAFLELEILAEEESQREPAIRRMEEILAGLGCSLKDTITTSYLSQLMEKNHNLGFASPEGNQP